MEEAEGKAADRVVPRVLLYQVFQRELMLIVKGSGAVVVFVLFEYS